MWLSLMASPWKTVDKTTNATNVIVLILIKPQPHSITHLNQNYTLRRSSAGTTSFLKWIDINKMCEETYKSYGRREKWKKHQRNAVQRTQFKRMCCVFFTFSFDRIHSLLLKPCNPTIQHTNNSQFPIKVGCLEKVTSRYYKFLLKRHNHLKMKREKHKIWI